jgi:hypothetical protein
MAIQISYTSTQGVIATKSHHVVNSVTYDAGANSRSNGIASISIYQSNDDYTAGSSSLDNIAYTFAMDTSDDGDNPSKQAYTALTGNTATKDEGASSSNTTFSQMEYNNEEKRKDV